MFVCIVYVPSMRIEYASHWHTETHAPTRGDEERRAGDRGARRAPGARDLQRRELGCDLAHSRLGVPEEHRRLRVEVELVLDAREARVHRALDDDHRALDEPGLRGHR